MSESVDLHDAVREQWAKLGGGAEEPAADAPEAQDGPEAQPEPETAPAGRDRDEKGRFKASAAEEPSEATPKAKAPASPKAGQDAVAGVAPPSAPAAAPVSPALPELKTPADWRAEAREHWPKLPRAAQEEAIRLYGETRKTLDENAALRRDMGGWQQAIAPAEHIFRATGQDPRQGVAQVVQTYAALHTAPPAVRGQIIGQLIRDFVGTDEAALSHVANGIHGGAGGAPAAQPRGVPQGLTAADVDRMLAQRDQQAKTDAAVREWKAFEVTADLLNEDGVRADTADLVGKWLRENPGMGVTREVYQKAYERAVLMNDGSAALWNKRKEAAAAEKASASTRATAAAVGLKSEPAGPGPNDNAPADSLEDEVRRQWNRLSKRR